MNVDSSEPIKIGMYIYNFLYSHGQKKSSSIIVTLSVTQKVSIFLSTTVSHILLSNIVFKVKNLRQTFF